MASFPALYRARAVDTTGRKVTAFVPAVFGEEPVSIVDSIGDLPADPGMGWVFFQAGNPEFPVWVGAQPGDGSGNGTGGGGGTDEVWVGPDVPIGTTLELWYDTDAVSPPAVGLSYVHNQATPSTMWTINHNLGWFPNVWVRDSAGTNVEGDVSQVNANTMTVTFSGAFAGTAYLS